MRRVIITEENVVFCIVDKDKILDFIPMADIISVDDLDGITLQGNGDDVKNQVKSTFCFMGESTIVHSRSFMSSETSELRMHFVYSLKVTVTAHY